MPQQILNYSLRNKVNQLSLFGTCQICLEKDKQIALLQDRITDLRSMVFTPHSSAEPSLQAREMDHIFNGSDEPIQVTSDEIVREAASILTGSYDHSQTEFE